jgi:hypothetical protein
MNSNTNNRRRRAPANYGALFVGTKRRRPTNTPTNPPTNERDADDNDEYRPLYWWQRD